MGSERTHDLKTWPPFFQAVLDGVKPFELRPDDRGFRAGDVLRLREWEPHCEAYTGRETTRTVTYVASGPLFGLLPNWCILGLSRSPTPEGGADGGE